MDNQEKPVIAFPWNEVKNISFSDKKFVIKPVNESSEDYKFYTQKIRTNRMVSWTVFSTLSHFRRAPDFPIIACAVAPSTRPYEQYKSLQGRYTPSPSDSPDVYGKLRIVHPSPEGGHPDSTGAETAGQGRAEAETAGEGETG